MRPDSTLKPLIGLGKIWGLCLSISPCFRKSLAIVLAVGFFPITANGACLYNRAAATYYAVHESGSADGMISSKYAMVVYKNTIVAYHGYSYSASTVPANMSTGGITVSRGTLRATEPYSYIGSGSTKYYDVCLNGFTPASSSALTKWNDADNRYNAANNTAVIGGESKGAMGVAYSYSNSPYGMSYNYPVLFKNGLFYAKPFTAEIQTDDPSAGVSNKPPVVANRTLNTNEDTSGAISLSASDPNAGDMHTFQIVAAPNAAHGTASIGGSTLTFTPAANWNGSTSLTYRARDSAGAWSNTATITITVIPVNDPPVAQSLSLVIDEDTTGALTLKATDIDSEANFTYQIVTPPAATAGTAIIQGDKLTFEPAQDWNGNASLTYRARDPEGAWSDPVPVSITVRPVNDQPVKAIKLIIRTKEGLPAVVRGAVAN